ncbi:MAG TPA: zinc-dependent metalloprotease family protein [Actinomycetota bacterium]|nr:zinc-dependent metalloprotease family protein [Actinomycetota bacterium]
MRRTLLVAAVASLVTGSLTQAGARIPRPPVPFDVEADCSAAPPAAHSVSGVTDDGRVVAVEVAVLLDGVKKSRARQLMAKAAGAYAGVGIDLVAVSFDKLPLTAPPGERPSIDAADAIRQAKAFFGGERPPGSDLVHLLTTKDLTLPNYGAATAGAAECAGGVQWPDKAFSVTEDSGLDAYSLDAPGLTNVMDSSAGTVAHELGHLLGGLHQYASCAEGADAADVTNRDPSPCTIMSDVVDVASLRFGTVESAVVRGYALRFADS